MSRRESIKFSNSTGVSQSIIVEPWAVEFLLPSGSWCEVFSVGGLGEPALVTEPVEGGIIIWINTDGAVYEYWQDGVLID